MWKQSCSEGCEELRWVIAAAANRKLKEGCGLLKKMKSLSDTSLPTAMAVGVLFQNLQVSLSLSLSVCVRVCVCVTDSGFKINCRLAEMWKELQIEMD